MANAVTRAALAAIALSALGMMGCGGEGGSNNTGGQGGAGAQGGEGGVAQGGIGGVAEGGAGGGAQGGAGGAPGPCEPESAKGVGNCDAFFGYAWNGQECIGISGCSCEGPACAGLPMDIAVCQDKHADCVSMGSVCDPQKASGFGPCATIVGYAWDGQMCVALSGCSCEGPDCAGIYDTGDACAAAHADCQ